MPLSPKESLLYYWDVLVTDFPCKAALTFLVSLVSWVVGGVDRLVSSLFMLMVLDFALGFARGWHTGNISGDKMKHGAMKFILYGVSVWVAVQMHLTMAALDPSVFGIKMSFAVRDWLLGYLVLNEAISCMEHLVYFRVPLPQSLLKRLKHYRGCVFATRDDTPAKPKEDA